MFKFLYLIDIIFAFIKLNYFLIAFKFNNLLYLLKEVDYE